MCAARSEIPIVDLSPLDSAADDRRTAAALVTACHEIGFCYLSHHGVEPAIEHNAFAVTRAFFALPDSAKKALSIENSPHFRGYTPLGREITKGRPDWREQIDLGLDERAAVVGPDEPPWHRLRGPNQWPPALPAMRTAITAWTAAMHRLAVTVLRSLATGLELPVDYFDACMLPRGDPHLKLIRYQGGAPGQHPSVMSPAGAREHRPLEAGEGGENAAGQGVGWHHDSGLLTFILQDQAAGLQVRGPDGIIAARPEPDTYLLNLGEMLQRATGGYLRATEHRVVSPPAGAERISLAYFAHPKLEHRFEPIELTAAMAAQASGADNPDPNDPVYSRFGDNYLKIRLRSHPEVAARFYADVRL